MPQSNRVPIAYYPKDDDVFAETRRANDEPLLAPIISEVPKFTKDDVVGKYTLHDRLASGGMASVYLGRVTGAADFSRIVAIKRMHPLVAENPTLVSRFRKEAWLGARLQHPNIVQTLDVVERNNEIFLVMEYVDGVTLASLRADVESLDSQIPVSITAGIMVPVLHGLHAAHEATDDRGHALNIVHRDFSPQNIIVGRNGHAKILDFGVAKTEFGTQATSVGQFTGKLGYLAPEQVWSRSIDKRTDIFAAGIVIWEALTGKRLFRLPDESEAATIQRVIHLDIPAPSRFNNAVSSELDRVVLRALNREPDARFATANEFAQAIEFAQPIASPFAIERYINVVCAHRLEALSRLLVGVRYRNSLPSPTENEEIPNSKISQDRPVQVSSIEPLGTHTTVSERIDRRKTVSMVAACITIGIGMVISAYSWIENHETGKLSNGPSVGAPMSSIETGSNSLMLLEVNQPEVVARDFANEMSSNHSGARVELRTDTPKPEAFLSATKKTTNGLKPIRAESKHVSKRQEKHNAEGPASSCNPPTYVDSEGFRHFKSGCLE
jgi:serine/threonine-protein kinase